jgi:hypothetical protein
MAKGLKVCCFSSPSSCDLAKALGCSRSKSGNFDDDSMLTGLC